jgi:hypothetical protein
MKRKKRITMKKSLKSYSIRMMKMRTTRKRVVMATAKIVMQSMNQ